jgi:integrase
MSTRRDNGEGSYVWDDARKSWRGCIRVHGHKRIHRYSSIPGDPGKQDCKKKIQEALKELEQGQEPDPKRNRWTLKQYLEWWTEQVKHGLRPGTLKNYLYHVNHHIIPSIGHRPLRSLTRGDVEKMLAEVEAKGLAASTRRAARITLSVALDYAFEEGMLFRNPVRKTKAPRGPRVVPLTFLSEDQARVFLAALRGHRWEAYALVALSLGLRNLEVVSLDWSDVDFERCRLQVRGTKTEAAHRLLPLPKALAVCLQTHLQAQKQTLSRHRLKWSSAHPVFGNIYRGQWKRINPRTGGRALETLLRSIDLPHMGMHGYRRSCASLLAAQGASPREIMEILGHSHYDLTMSLYTQVTPSQVEGAVQKLDDFLSKSDEKE